MSALATACDRHRARSATDRGTSAAASVQPWWTRRRPALSTSLRDDPQGRLGPAEAWRVAMQEGFAALLRPISHSPPAGLCGYGEIVFDNFMAARLAQPQPYLNGLGGKCKAFCAN